eukprot:g12746.t1
MTPEAAAAAAAAGRRKTSGEGPVKRPSAGGVAPRKKSSLSVDARQSAAARAEGGLGSGGGGVKSPGGRRKRAGEGVAEQGGLTEEDLSAPITVGLCETPTMILLEIRGSAVATDLRDFGRYQQEKQDHEKRVQERIGSDRYASRHAQTVNWALKTKEVTAAAAATKDASCAATTWEIFDEQSKGTDQGTADDGVYGGAGSKAEVGGEETAVQRQAGELATVTLASHGCLLETASTVAPPPLPAEATTDTGKGGGGGGGGGGVSTNAVNANFSRNRGISGTGVTGPIGGGGGGGGAGRGKANNANGKNSHSSVGGGGGASMLNVDGGGGELAEEAVESPMDARGVAEVLAAQQAEEIMVSKQLLDSLELVERSLFQNFLHSKQLEYRNYPPVELPAEESLLGGLGGGPSGGGGGGGASIGGCSDNRRSDAWETMSSSTKQEGGGLKNAGLQKLWTHRYPFPGGGGGGVGGGAAVDSGGGSSNAQHPAGVAAPGGGGGGGDAKPNQASTSRAPRSGGVEAGGVGAMGSGGGGPAAGITAGASGGAAAAEQARRDRTVTALCFHQYNGDILAVGYGAFFFSPNVHKGGAVLFWSVRNPEYPERTIHTQSSVTSLDFAERHPTLLAVGMYDGTIAIYDTAREGENFSAAVAESSTSHGKHTDPVWQVQWVNKGVERGETLVSISTDGRVVEWSMKKGLSFSPLMVLKRIGNTEGVISRQASGLSFDFSPGDGATYFAGTEDGLIHKCSVSYNEQYLDTYHGHTGPVYRIRCSPFCDRLFLSASADWTVRLWEERQTAPLHTLRSVDLWDVVNDVAWSLTCSTVFASVTGDGRVQLWDLAHSTLDPIVSTDPDSKSRTGSGSIGKNGATGGTPSLDGATTATGGHSPRPRDANNTGDGGRSELGGLSPRSPLARSQGLSGGGGSGGVSSAGAGVGGGGLGGQPGVRPRGVQLTAVTFAANAPVMAVGDSRGCVDVYKIVGVDLTPDMTRDEQVERLRKAVMTDDREGRAAA